MRCSAAPGRAISTHQLKHSAARTHGSYTHTHTHGTPVSGAPRGMANAADLKMPCGSAFSCAKSEGALRVATVFTASLGRKTEHEQHKGRRGAHQHAAIHTPSTSISRRSNEATTRAAHARTHARGATRRLTSASLSHPPFPSAPFYVASFSHPPPFPSLQPKQSY